MTRKHVWRLVAASLVLALLVGVTAGCGGKTTTWKQVKKNGVLRVGIEGTYPPFNFVNDQKQYDGFDVDIANEVAKRLGVKAEFVGVEWKGIIAGLLADKYDIVIAQMSITEERKKSVDFTEPYVMTGAVLITRKGDDRFKQLSDIKGAKVGVGTGTNFEALAKTVQGADVKGYAAFNDYLQDLLNKRLDVIVNDQLLAGDAIKKGSLPIQVSSGLLEQDRIGMAIKKDNPDFLQKVNEVLAAMKTDGTYDTIYMKWFGMKPPAW
ncbi:MAG: transporter substrate-binding domain-containing protein [Bacillota bacterium]